MRGGLGTKVKVCSILYIVKYGVLLTCPGVIELWEPGKANEVIQKEHKPEFDHRIDVEMVVQKEHKQEFDHHIDVEMAYWTDRGQSSRSDG